MSITKLTAAFDRVSDPKDWKAPIDAWVCEKDFPLANKAVEYFTATTLRVTDTSSNLMRVQSVGYRDGPAGP